MENLKSAYRKRKVLVTGGLGFLGSNLTRQLIQMGAQVTVLDCLLPIHGGNRFNLDGLKKNLRWIKGDIRNGPLMRKLLKKQDILFNIAAQTSHTDSMKHPLLDASINTSGQITLLEACRQVNPRIRIVYCSTRAVYGSSDKKNSNESASLNPLDIYSANKLAGENYHKIYASVHGLNTTTLRVANGYGPRAQMLEPSFGILNWFIRLAIDNQNIKIFGDGKQIRDYLYVDDIVRSFLIVAGRDDLKGKIYNVGSGLGTPLIEIVKKVVRFAGKGKIIYVPWPEANKRIDVGDFIADVRKIGNKTGWRAQTSLESGLKKTIEFYKKYKKNYWT